MDRDTYIKGRPLEGLGLNPGGNIQVGRRRRTQRVPPGVSAVREVGGRHIDFTNGSRIEGDVIYHGGEEWLSLGTYERRK